MSGSKFNISFHSFLLYLSVLLAILTQCYLDASFLRIVMYASWMILFAYIMISCKFILHISPASFHFFALVFVFAIYVFVQSFFTDMMALDGNYFHGALLVLFIYIVGVMTANKTKPQIIGLLVKVYVAGTLFFAFYLFITYVGSISNFFTSSTYLISQKNSAGQIMSIAILLLLSQENGQGKIKKSSLVLSGILAFFLLITQCRSSMVGLAVAVLYYFFKLKLRYKYLYLIVILTVGLALFGDSLIVLVSQSLRLEYYQDASLDTISSGRIGLIYAAFEEFLGSPFWGVGHYYVDMFYISVLTELGIIGTPILFTIYGHRVIRNFKLSKRTCAVSTSLLFNYSLFLRMGSLFYLVVSCFEGLPPFGPGVSSCMFWLLSGFFDMWDARLVCEEVMEV